MLDNLKKHFKDPLKYGFPVKKDESKSAVIHYGHDVGTVNCSAVLDTYGEKNLIEYMQEKRNDSIVVVERLLEMV